jgi:hypothetical protein
LYIEDQFVSIPRSTESIVLLQSLFAMHCRLVN